MGMRPGFWGQSVGGMDWRFSSAGKLGIPKTVAVLVRESGPSERVAALYNTGDRPTRVQVELGCTLGRKVERVTAEPGGDVVPMAQPHGRRRFDLSLTPKAMATVRAVFE